MTEEELERARKIHANDTTEPRYCNHLRSFALTCLVLIFVGMAIGFTLIGMAINHERTQQTSTSVTLSK